MVDHTSKMKLNVKNILNIIPNNFTPEWNTLQLPVSAGMRAAAMATRPFPK